MLGDLNGHALRQNASFAHAGERYTHDSTECFAAAGTGGGGATAPPDGTVPLDNFWHPDRKGIWTLASDVSRTQKKGASTGLPADLHCRPCPD